MFINYYFQRRCPSIKHHPDSADIAIILSLISIFINLCKILS